MVKIVNEYLNLSSQYWLAAEALFSNSNFRELEMPIGFSYLHSMETLMKGIIHDRGNLSEELRKTHDLSVLAKELDVLDAEIEDLSNIDTSLTIYRYPAVDRKEISISEIRQLCLYLREKLNYVNLN